MSSIQLTERRLGIQLPVFSLPGSGSRGCFDDAPGFIEFLSTAGVSVWQLLPLGPTHSDHSPYLSLSAHAGNPDFIGLGLLENEELAERGGSTRESAISDSFAALEECSEAAIRFNEFRQNNRHWLDDYAQFMLLRELHDNAHWYDWPVEFRDREPSSLAGLSDHHAARLDYYCWQQFLFFNQWQAIRNICKSVDIKLFGDIPLYVSLDSVDVWSNRQFFSVDDEGHANAVAGVPPDYFSATGQRWGNPLFDWDALRKDHFNWWVERIKSQMRLYDLLRIDHFRGLQAYWRIPADSRTAEQGSWCEGPGKDLLNRLFDAIPGLKLIAEDLGTITLEVNELREAFAIPGMRVLQFGFDGIDDNPHAPKNLNNLDLVYTGTHDNDTSQSWYQGLPDWQRHIVDQELSKYQEDFPLSLVECALDSPASLVILQIQDLLGLGSESRINTPGTTVNNWNWRLDEHWPRQQVIDLLRCLKKRYNR